MSYVPVRSRVRISLIRPLLLLGAERELVLFSGMIAAMLVFSVGDLVLAACGVIFWFVVLAILQRMAKHDYQLSKIYIRHANRKIYYPAAAHIGALEPDLKKHQ